MSDPDSRPLDGEGASPIDPFRQMAEQAHEGLRGVGGPMWRDRLIS